MKRTAYDMLYLAACAVNKTAPDRERVSGMSLDMLFEMAERHSLTALLALSLEKSGIDLPQNWKEEKAKTIRKNILFDSERAKILSFMEEKGIWYMPLKGVLLKDYYPAFGVRQMGDNDILFDRTYQKEVYHFMVQNGYESIKFDTYHHDVYQKPPVLSFEMHMTLFDDDHNEFCSYYEDVKDRLLPVEGKRFAYRFTDEDFYIHVTAHEYKHFVFSGMGLRALVDRYVYLKKKTNLNFSYIEAECGKLGISEFEKESRELCLSVLGSEILPEITEAQTKMLECYLFSATHGTLQKMYTTVLNEYGEASDHRTKLRYYFSRLFPKIEFYKKYSPIAYRYKILIPFAWLKRVILTFFKRRKEIEKEIEQVQKL